MRVESGFRQKSGLLSLKKREVYKKGGAEEIVMSGAAAKKYIALANGTPVERLKKLNSPEAKELSRLFHGQ